MLGNVQSSSMAVTWASSEVLDKYHSCCIENGIFSASLVVFIPNFTAAHCISGIIVNTTVMVKSKKNCLLGYERFLVPSLVIFFAN